MGLIFAEMFFGSGPRDKYNSRLAPHLVLSRVVFSGHRLPAEDQSFLSRVVCPLDASFVRS